MTTEAQARQRIRNYVLESLAPRGIESLEDDGSLLESGVADSLGVFQVIAFLEEEFGISIGDHEIVQRNFESIDAITAFVTRKLAQPTT